MNKMAFNLTLQLLAHLETWPYKVRFVIIMDKFKMYKQERGKVMVTRHFLYILML